MPITKLYKIILISFILLLENFTLSASSWELLVNLKGDWKFRIGDNLKWAETKLDDRYWDDILVPTAWETQGFHAYDGYAWYRKRFVHNKEYANQNLYLSLGYIDDVDEVYINGNLIGFSGSFPPYFQTAYNAFRRYPIPPEFLNLEGENIIAIRVYDAKIDGGILSGEIGIVANTEYNKLDVDLSGLWHFSLGDNARWKNPQEPSTDWEKIMVPLFWEKQGFINYDGYAWYKKTFYLPKKLEAEELILLLGMIDDYDQTFVNSRMVGSTGFDNSNQYIINDDYAYQTVRKYALSRQILNFGGYNTIAIRVYDKYIDGGIYKGPIGIIRQGAYTDFWRSWWR